jgi:hypothetical protein
MVPTVVAPVVDDDQNTPVGPKKKFLIISVIVLGVILTILTGYIVYTQFIKTPESTTTKDNTTQEENTTDDSSTEQSEDTGVCEVGEECPTDEEETEEDTTTTFNGEVVTAELPEGWSIIEYFDGDGTESLPDMGLTYSGLTALDIINPENKQVFTLQGVSGIGFIGCPNYAVFDDDSPSYRAQQESASSEMGETLNTIDYTDTEYEEFEWLGATVRRIGDKYYYDTQEGNNYFEPPCVEGLITLEGLYFTDEDDYKYESYFYGPTDDSTSDDLVIIDQILQEMQLVD